MKEISIIIPAYREEAGIGPTVRRVQAVATAQGWSAEIIVVDDGSDDRTGEEAKAAGAHVLRNPVNGGYGLSLQRGIRTARHELIAITDADGTYPVESLPQLLTLMEEGVDMAVGARQGEEMRRGRWKHPARILFRLIVEFVAGRRIPDVNSGLRMMRRSVVLPYLPQTCLGFSFTTSITLIFMLNGRFVAYHPVVYAARIGASKIRHVRDTLRTAQIITSITAAHNPIKLALLVDVAAFIVAVPLLALTRALFPYPFAALFVLTTAQGLLASLPIVFMLGCVAEALRPHRETSS